MQIQAVSSQGVSSLSPMAPSFKGSPQVMEAYNSSIRSLRVRRMGLGEAIAQMIEAFAMLAMLPFFIYTFFLTTVSLIFLPFLIILIPLILINEVLREILHVILPWVFPDPRYRY